MMILKLGRFAFAWILALALLVPSGAGAWPGFDVPKPKPEVQKLLDEAQAEKTYQGTIPILERALQLAKQLGDKQGQADAHFWLGKCRHPLEELDTAYDEFEKSLALYTETGDVPSQAAALTHMGLMDQLRSNWARALPNYERALKMVRGLGDREGQWTILNNLGRAHLSMGDAKKALPYFEESVGLAAELKYSAGEIDGLTSLAQCHEQLGELAKAQSLLEKALEQTRKVKDRNGEAVVLNNLGLFHSNRSRHMVALSYYDQSQKIYLELDDKNGLATVLNNLGLVMSAVGEQTKAIEYFESALTTYRAVKNTPGEATTLNNLGMAHSARDNNKVAVDYYNQAVALYRQLGDRNREALTLNNIGTLYAGLAQHEKAIEVLIDALKISRELGNKSMQGTALTNIAQSEFALGLAEKSLEHLNLAIPLLRATETIGILTIALNNLGQTYSELGKVQEAVDAFVECIKFCGETGNVPAQAVAMNNVGLLLLDDGSPKEAIEWFEQAVVLARGVGLRSAEATSLANMSATKERLGQPAQAIVFGKEAIRVLQQVRESNKGLDAAWQDSFTSKVSSIYRDLAERLAEAGRISEAQQVLDLLKDGEYQSFLRQRAGAKAETVDLTSREQTWLAKYQELGENMAKLAAERDELLKIEPDARTEEQKKRLSELRATADAAAAAFQTFIGQVEEAFSKAGADTDRLNDLKGSVAMQTALKQLPNHPAAIYTLVTADGVRVIASVPGLTLPRQAKSDVSAIELSQKILTFRQALTDPRFDPRPLGAELYDLLFRPIEKDLADAKVETLMWSLDGVLRYIPIWALYDRETKKFLVEKYPSAIFTPRTVDRLTMLPRPGGSAQFGVTQSAKVGGADFPALPAVAREIADVHAVLGGSKPKMDGDFTYDAFREALESGPRTVHIATHFRFKSGSDTESFLLLGNGKALSIETLKNMEDGALSSVDLLVLSACETAVGGDGSEFEGFALLAQLKGAGSVIATLWPVSDDSTALLMRAFYTNRKTHPDWTKLQSLRAAQLAMIRGELKDTGGDGVRATPVGQGPANPSLPAWPKGEPAYSHPYYWAPFVLTGNWR